MLEWNYKSDVECSTGYEDVMDRIRITTPEEFNAMTREEKDDVVNSILSVFREKNIYPIYYYNDDGIKKEIQKCIDKKVELKNNELTFRYVQGLNLCRFLFPNLTMVNKASCNVNMYTKFYTDKYLKKAIELTIRYEVVNNVYQITRTMQLLNSCNATNFHPMRAKALYEKYCPKNGVIYDFACGFGGRMLGALSSKNDYVYTGVEPCEETFIHLNELGECIEKVTGRQDSYKVYQLGSEDYIGEKNSCDFAFSSPPYFNCEVYSDEETQCYNKFNTLDKWIEGYVRPTIQNIYNMLKKDRYYAVNISDFNIGKTRIKFVDEWIKISQEIGFTYIEEVKMRIESGHYNHDINVKKPRKEGIFVFRK